MSATNIKVDGVQSEYANLPVRARFLAAISQLNADVLLSLKQLSATQARPPTRRELKLWARRWNMETDWIVEWAAQTIKWQREGPNRRWERFFHPPWSPRSRSERAPATLDEIMKGRLGAIDFGSWIGDPTTRSATHQRAARALQTALRESVDAVSTAAIASGLFEARRRRSRKSTKKSRAPMRSTSEVFLWLAGYQTCAWSRTRIAGAAGVHRNAVAMAIRNLAIELKLKLRPDHLYDEGETEKIISLKLKKARKEEREALSFLSADNDPKIARQSMRQRYVKSAFVQRRLTVK
jgi:hypothetical protein